MDFEFNDEQNLLNESVSRLVADRYDFQQREHILASDERWSREIWIQFAEMGLLALPFAEDDGGFDGSGVEMMIVMEALGKGLVVEPYFATVILAGGVLRHAANAEQRSRHPPGLA
jgi:alkylation response protein AidB-like acyl-CoA dehydrogenase